MTTNWNAAHAKVEVCEGGVRLLVPGGETRSMKGCLSGWALGIIELP